MQGWAGSELDGCTLGSSLAPNLTGWAATPAAGASIRARLASAARRPLRRGGVLGAGLVGVILFPPFSLWMWATCVWDQLRPPRPALPGSLGGDPLTPPNLDPPSAGSRRKQLRAETL